MDEDNEEIGLWDFFLKSCKDFGCVQNIIVGFFVKWKIELYDVIYVQNKKLC